MTFFFVSCCEVASESAVVEYAVFEHIGVTPVIFCEEILLDCFAMTVIMHVGAYKINHIVLDEILCHAAHFFIVVAGETEQIYLEESSLLMQLGVAVAAVEIVTVALGVCQNGFIPFHFQIKKHFVEVPRFLQK